MKINFLTGNLVLRNNRTGVHTFHEKILNEIIKQEYYRENMVISYYGTIKDLGKKYSNYKSEKYIDNVKFSNKLVRILTYVLPIEFFFGKSDIYICDGMIPITYNKSIKVAVIFDVMVKIYPDNYKPMMKIYLNYYFWKCRKADQIITISETTKQDIISCLHIPEEKIHVVYLGYDNEEKEQNIDELVKENNIISRLGLNKDYVFYVGDMRKNKNLLNAIKGVEYANKNGNDITFYIAGMKSGEYETLHSYIVNKSLEDKIIFLGYVSEEEKKVLYKNAIALLFVSEYEGFGIPILEASGYKIPVITSNVSSMKEIAKECSILVDPHDYVEIGKAIESVLDVKTRTETVERQTRILGKYTWKRTGEDIIHILNEIRENVDV